MPRLKETLTTGQVAEICHVAPRTVTKWFDSGRLKGYKIPGSRDRRIPLAELKRFAKEYNIPVAGIAAGQRKLLFIGDDGHLSTEYRASLEGLCEVVVARTAFEAGLAVQKSLPDIVLISLLSPAIDACSICQHMRTLDELAQTRIIAVADNLTESERTALVQKGFNGCATTQTDISRAFRDWE
ncbi:MAG TPA: helix-turn-helix domain-containing protein [Sedimentisphaerales bacterium]|nr:helix-turn-helix domain-containing protein [Sedimentisphaerales bacterium]